MIFLSYFFKNCLFFNHVKTVKKKNTYTYFQNHVERVIFGNIFAYGREFSLSKNITHFSSKNKADFYGGFFVHYRGGGVRRK